MLSIIFSRLNYNEIAETLQILTVDFEVYMDQCTKCEGTKIFVIVWIYEWSTFNAMLLHSIEFHIYNETKYIKPQIGFAWICSNNFNGNHVSFHVFDFLDQMIDLGAFECNLCSC